MEPLGQNRSGTPEHTVHRARNAGADGHHAACERFGVRRFDEQVGMRALQRVVHEPEVAACANVREATL